MRRVCFVRGALIAGFAALMLTACSRDPNARTAGLMRRLSGDPQGY
jgi:hypothetical protein